MGRGHLPSPSEPGQIFVTVSINRAWRKSHMPCASALFSWDPYLEPSHRGQPKLAHTERPHGEATWRCSSWQPVSASWQVSEDASRYPSSQLSSHPQLRPQIVWRSAIPLCSIWIPEPQNLWAWLFHTTDFWGGLFWSISDQREREKDWKKAFPSNEIWVEFPPPTPYLFFGSIQHHLINCLSLPPRYKKIRICSKQLPG